MDADALNARYDKLTKLIGDAQQAIRRLVNGAGMRRNDNKFWSLLGTQLMMLEQQLEQEPSPTGWRLLCENQSRLGQMTNHLRRELPNFPPSAQADCQCVLGNLMTANGLLEGDEG